MRDSFTAESSPTGLDVVVRVRLDDQSGELIISEWAGDKKLNERRLFPHEH